MKSVQKIIVLVSQEDIAKSFVFVIICSAVFNLKDVTVKINAIKKLALVFPQAENVIEIYA